MNASTTISGADSTSLRAEQNARDYSPPRPTATPLTKFRSKAWPEPARDHAQRSKAPTRELEGPEIAKDRHGWRLWGHGFERRVECWNSLPLVQGCPGKRIRLLRSAFCNLRKSCPALCRASTPRSHHQLQGLFATAPRDKPTAVRFSKTGCKVQAVYNPDASCPGLSRASTPSGSRQLRKFLATARRGWPGQARP
jgi:hypothetical protein